MMKVRLIKLTKLNELLGQIEDNLDNYRTGCFEYLKSDSSIFIETPHEFEEATLASVQCTANDHREVENCILLHEIMGNLSRYLARDERLWVYLVHTDLLEYSLKRWPIPDNDDLAIKHIRTHFFVSGARGFERDNAAARLWWMASLCSRVKDISLEDALFCFLYKYDVRANIIERPTTALNINTFKSIIRRLHNSYHDDKSLFERDKFRAVMKELNLRGGVKLLSALEDQTVDSILEECVANQT